MIAAAHQSSDTWDKGLTAKERSTVESYCNPGSETFNTWSSSYLKAGYSNHKGYHRDAIKVRSKPHVREAIRLYRAKTVEKLEHNRDIAIKELYHNIALYDSIIEAGQEDGKTLTLPYIQAIKARTEAIKELNAISMLHGTKVQTEQTDTEQLSPEHQAIYEEHTRSLLLKLSQSPSQTDTGPNRQVG